MDQPGDHAEVWRGMAFKGIAAVGIGDMCTRVVDDIISMLPRTSPFPSFYKKETKQKSWRKSSLPDQLDFK